jgi:glycosyltransferase involved in cell wall biosynthesis
MNAANFDAAAETYDSTPHRRVPRSDRLDRQRARGRDGADDRHRSVGEPIRVVFFDGSPPSYGGGSEMVHRLLTRLDDAAFEPVLLAHTEDELHDRLRGEVDVDVVPFRGALGRYDGQILDSSPLAAIGTAVRIGQFNVEARSTLLDADVLWCMNLRSLLTIAPYALASPTPVIWNVGLGQPSEGAYRYLNAVGLRLADRVFIESERQARRLFTDAQFAAHADAFEIFPKGVDTERFTSARAVPPLSGETATIGTAASLTPRKGVETFVEAAIELLETSSDRGSGAGSPAVGAESHGAAAETLQFLIAGEPPHEADREYEDRLRRRVEESGHADAFEFVGWVEDMPAFYDRLDAFVLPSRNEGIPGVVREALSMELPVVATDVGGTREVLPDGETGLLIDPDDPDQLADALRSLLADPERARELGAAGRQLVERRFSVEAYVGNYEAFLREVAA